jgi:S1-C subfamily serine protease
MSSADTNGLRLMGVSPGSPAEQAGLRAGDLIVEFAGRPVKDLYQYSDALYAHKPGDEVGLVILRNGERKSITVRLGKRG